MTTTTKNYIAFYRITRPRGRAIMATSKLMTITHSTESSIIGWDVMKLIRHCEGKKYIFEKLLTVVCLDGHEDDPVEVIKDEEPGKQKAIAKPLNKKRK